MISLTVQSRSSEQPSRQCEWFVGSVRLVIDQFIAQQGELQNVEALWMLILSLESLSKVVTMLLSGVSSHGQDEHS